MVRTGGSRLPTVTYSMPRYAVCDCLTCTTISVFTTMLPGFGSNGPRKCPYIIIETYVGMSVLPYFPAPTAIPYGFTTAVETCTDCGAQPITATIVFPKTCRPWGQDLSESTGPLATDHPGALPLLLPGAATASSNAGPVETTLIASKEDGPKTIHAGGQDSGAGHGGAIHIGAFRSNSSQCS